MDIHMPVMDGIEAIKHIRSMNDEILRNQKIIILTASVTRESLVQLEGYEIQGFLNKPIKGELLKSALVA
jgi:two-component system sensor histidine kinase/response regulator